MILTTVHKSDQLVSRPMAVCVDNFDGTLRFFAPMKSRVVDDIAADPRVNISYTGPLTSLSISGSAIVTVNLASISARWRHGLYPWFPEGMDDVAMIEVVVDGGRVWRNRPSPDVTGLGLRR